MKKNIHKYFTTSILHFFDITNKEKKKIIKADIGQDGLIKSTKHYGEQARDIFLETFVKYQKDQELKQLGKLLHFLLDISTPFHIERSFNPFMLFYHDLYESQGEKFITEGGVKDAVMKVGKDHRKDIEVVEGINKLLKTQEDALEEFAIIGNKGENLFSLPPEDECWEFIKRYIKYRLFRRRKDEEWFKERVDIDGIKNELKELISDFEAIGDIRKLSVKDLLKILHSIEIPEPDGKLRVNIRFAMFWALATIKHYLECIERSVPIAIALCGMKYQWNNSIISTQTV